ncbi:hypothetical protein [Spirosoma endbachense]|uniref:Outer membrane beta-barrel protein n=1 Tax=Spirosoma endbachense TaxID=2666025 RepID=A0A6P1W5U2_9BACT|nr:hypothetical protein [Spirosoma endbachense]QHV99407.1 hypothetical protein GJR95_32295 [Spirosoma endbachense]
MKALLLLVLINTLVGANTPVVYAQQTSSVSPPLPFRKGSWQVGLKDGYGGSPLLGHRNTVYLQAGYYIANRLLIGFGGSYGREVPDIDQAIGLSIQDKGIVALGPLIRYQLSSGRLSPYTELSYQYGRHNTRVEKSLSFTPGLSVGLLAGLRIDLSYSFQFIGSGGGFPDGPTGQPQVGITYLFQSRF